MGNTEIQRCELEILLREASEARGLHTSANAHAAATSTHSATSTARILEVGLILKEKEAALCKESVGVLVVDYLAESKLNHLTGPLIIFFASGSRNAVASCQRTFLDRSISPAVTAGRAGQALFPPAPQLKRRSNTDTVNTPSNSHIRPADQPHHPTPVCLLLSAHVVAAPLAGLVAAAAR